jgi:hypothetical protein
MLMVGGFTMTDIFAAKRIFSLPALDPPILDELARGLVDATRRQSEIPKRSPTH